MTVCSSDMKRSAAIVLILNTVCVFSQILHDFSVFTGCFVNGTVESHFEFDAELVLYVDFKKREVVYTVPAIIDHDPTQTYDILAMVGSPFRNRELCLTDTAEMDKAGKYSEEKDPPESLLYPAEKVVLGVENSLICFVNHFYPPAIKVSWTKNGGPVSEGVSLGRYVANKDQTFHQFSTLTFTPRVGDIYSCTVEHSALEKPKTRIWEPDFSHQSVGPDVFCGVGLSLGFLGVATGVFLIAKGHYVQ